jgi:hypothetical protein
MHTKSTVTSTVESDNVLGAFLDLEAMLPEHSSCNPEMLDSN